MKNKKKNENYYAICGLIALADVHRESMNTIEKELRRLTGEIEEMGHCGDVVWGGGSADDLIEKVKYNNARQSKK